MKTFKTIGLMLVIASGSLVEAAEACHTMRVDVPFAFQVRGEQFAAGHYDIRETDSGVIFLQGEGKSVVVIGMPLAQPNAGDTSALKFSSTPSRVLEAVAMEGEGTRAVPVHADRKLSFGR